MTDSKSFGFLSWLTGIVVMTYIGASVFSFLKAAITWQDFSGAVGPMAGLLLGYWVRGEQ